MPTTRNSSSSGFLAYLCPSWCTRHEIDVDQNSIGGFHAADLPPTKGTASPFADVSQCFETVSGEVVVKPAEGSISNGMDTLEGLSAEDCHVLSARLIQLAERLDEINGDAK